MRTIDRKVVLAVVFALAAGGCASKPGERIPITTSSPEARELFREGYALRDRFHSADAHKLFRRAIALDSNFALGYLGIASTEMTGSEHYSSLLQADELSEPEALPAQRRVGFGISLVNELNAEMMREAGRHIDRVSEGERLWIRGQRASSEGDQSTALKCFRDLAALHPKDAMAHRLLGDCYYRFGLHDSAVQAYLRAVELDSTMSVAYNMLGYEYQAIGDNERAEAMFRRYAEMLPEEPNPRDSYAEFLLRAGRYEDSKQWYEQALAIDPAFVNAHIGVATNLMLLNREAEARARLAAAMAEAEHPTQRRMLMLAEAISYLYERNSDSCLAVLERRAATGGGQHPDPVEAAADLDVQGQVLSEIGEYERAGERFRDALERSNAPMLPADMRERYRAHHHARMGCLVSIPTGDIASAEKHFEELRACMRDTVSLRSQTVLHYFTARLAMARQDYAKAIEEFRRADPRDPVVAVQLGRACELAGDLRGAESSYREAMSVRQLNSVPHVLARLHAADALDRLRNRAG